jgi:enamine deaminase RidA (YjgF/YER057c/UK114 family)
MAPAFCRSFLFQLGYVGLRTVPLRSRIGQEVQMGRIVVALLVLALSPMAQANEFMEMSPYQSARAFSPAVVTSGGMTVWIAGQTATEDGQGNSIAGNFEAQARQVMVQVAEIMKRAGGSLDDIVSITVFIKEPRYGDKFVELRKEIFRNGNYPGSALITVANFARPGIEIEVQAVGVIGGACSNDNPCSLEGKARKAQSK